MDRMILPLLGALFLLFLGASGVWVYDHHEPIGFHVQFLWWHPGFDLPDSLQTREERAEAQKEQAVAALVPWQRAYANIVKSISTIQAAQQSVIDAGQIKLDVANTDARWSIGSIQAGETYRKQYVASLPTADSDVCQRARAADAAFVASLGK